MIVANMLNTIIVNVRANSHSYLIDIYFLIVFVYNTKESRARLENNKHWILRYSIPHNRDWQPL